MLVMRAINASPSEEDRTMRYVLRQFNKSGSAMEDIGSFETLEKARSAMKLAAQGRKLTPLEQSYCLRTGEQYLIFKEGYWEPLTRVDRSERIE
jgi:hypothetical protein